MSRNPAWQTNGDLTRSQLALFHDLGDRISLTQDDRRRALDLDDRTWAAWMAFLADGPMPAEPPLPDMLVRLGTTAFNLAAVAAPDLCGHCPAG